MLATTAKTFYNFVDQPVAALSAHHSLLITCVRIWARGAMARTYPLRHVAPRFVLSGQAGALAPFHAFMLVFGNSAARVIGLSASEDGRITDDEALLLTALEAASHNGAERVRLAPATLICAQRLDAVAHKATLLMLR